MIFTGKANKYKFETNGPDCRVLAKSAMRAMENQACGSRGSTNCPGSPGDTRIVVEKTHPYRPGNRAV